ncbi:c-type cytochrome [Halomonas sp. MCCC 1A11036]|uniref:C-type cytochrome n=1 Tax=Billgrantia zhangzhouensis TaxID=2733481 RepID=A0ABS9AL83_9GAMM|nr:cytochrome c [Halomonas zhangzhouensis]MCE8022473.1 c-type cytochrome [Halomonas zhangzhouensis]
MMVFKRSPLFAALAAILLASTALASEPGDYVVEDGKVDPSTYEGYLVYTRACMACHGPDGLGSSFAPNLIQAAERLGWAEFAGTIAAGREIQPGQVMPSFADDPYVMGNIPKIFSYMLARGEGGLGRGRPQIIESMQEETEEAADAGEDGNEAAEE